MPDVATGGFTSLEQALHYLAQAIRGDATSPTSGAGRDIDLDPPVAPAPVAPAASWTPQRPFLAPPPRATGSPLPRGRAPGLLEQGVLAFRGALGLGDNASDYSSLEGQDAATRASATGELLGMLAPFLGGAMAMAKLPESPESLRILNPIKAYHGTPHDFERFDLSKVGSGEGSQAYGHGLYFAEHPSTAEAYKTELSPMVVETPHGRYELPATLSQADPVRDRDLFEKTLARVTGQLNEWEAGPGVAKVDYMQPEVDNSRRIKSGIEALLNGEGRLVSGGRTYEVNIHASPDELLDWDTPLSEQSPAVQSKVGAAINGRYGPGTFESLAQSGADPRDLVRNFDDLSNGGMEALLHQHGVKGIQYFDQASRAAKSGTRNYVIFNDAIIEIAKKYGVSLPVAASIYQQQQQRKGQAP